MVIVAYTSNILDIDSHDTGSWSDLSVMNQLDAKKGRLGTCGSVNLEKQQQDL